jgi:hypothetical protein
LRSLSERTGNRAYLRAANAIFQQTGGRPAVDDRKLVEEARWLLSSGVAPNMHQAVLQVARTVCGSQSERSVAERLRRKMLSEA